MIENKYPHQIRSAARLMSLKSKS